MNSEGYVGAKEAVLVDAVALPTSISAKSKRGRMLLFVLLLAICNLIWSAQPTAVKYVEKQLGPIAITFLPFYVTTLLLVPVLIFKRRANPQAVRPTWGDWKKFMAAGIGGQIIAQFCSVWGVTKSTASNCAILGLLIPVITAVLASVMLRERLTRLRMMCLALGLVGVMIMSVNELRQASFLKSSYLLGNLLILASCTGSGFYNVYCKGLLARFAEVEILIFSYITASLASVGVLIWREPDCFSRLANLDAPGWLAMGFLAFFMYGASMLLFFHVLQHLPVTVASASLYLVPIFGVTIAMLLLGEQLYRFQVVGAMIVLVPTVLIMKYDPGA